MGFCVCLYFGRECIPFVVLPYSRVIEIGCADGTTCRLLFKAVGATGGRVLGVDIGKAVVEQARKSSPAGIRYEVPLCGVTMVWWLVVVRSWVD